jgi:hypothetical protein
MLGGELHECLRPLAFDSDLKRNVATIHAVQNMQQARQDIAHKSNLFRGFDLLETICKNNHVAITLIILPKLLIKFHPAKASG